MPRTLHRLTARQVQTLSKPGRHADGAGLFLKIRPGGSRQWIFLYAYIEKGRRIQKEIGLGGAGAGGVSLAEAREKAAELRRERSRGVDPLTIKKAEATQAATRTVSFGAFADDYVRSHRAGWSNPKHASQWAMTMGPAYCKVIRGKPVSEINVDDVLKVLTPIWQAKPETARRIRMRLERVLDAAKVKGLRLGDNPARWRGHLDHLLPKHGRTTKSHHAAMAFSEVPAFMEALGEKSSMSALALQFLILTAARTGEVLAARWSEFDLANRVWIIPANRMKAKRKHQVPLTDAAIRILETIKGKHADFVFPGPSDKGPLSNMTLLALLRRMGRGDVTAHGFRSSFRDWAAETTNFPREVAEMALAHTIENKTEAAYRRGYLFEKRRPLMQAWADFCTAQPSENVVSFPNSRGST